MFNMPRSIVALVSLALACRGVLANWPLHAEESWSNGRHKVWYGDGRAYAGPTVPNDVETAFNITINGDRSQLVVIEPDTEANPSSEGSLEAPTFMTFDLAPGATGPVRFLHSAVGLTQDDIYFFANVDGFWYPTTRDRILADLTKGVYLIPTDAEETYAVHWFDSGEEAEGLGGIRATLSMRGDD